MAPRPVLAGSAVAAGLWCAWSGSGAFVGAPAAGARHLRASVAGDAATPAQAAPSSGGGALAATTLAGSLLAAAGLARARRGAVRRAAEAGSEVVPDIPRPEDLLESPKFPLYMGGTNGYMSRATRERHAITWTAKEEAIFELPIGGWATMNAGENLCYFRKKEQCIALGKALRQMKINDYKVYRIAKDGTVTFMHPADGVFPEKVNKGRVQVNGRPFNIGSNPQQSELKFTKYAMKVYEADPLTTLFVKAKVHAFGDQENLFPLPQPDMDMLFPETGKTAPGSM